MTKKQIAVASFISAVEIKARELCQPKEGEIPCERHRGQAFIFICGRFMDLIDIEGIIKIPQEGIHVGE